MQKKACCKTISVKKLLNFPQSEVTFMDRINKINKRTKVKWQKNWLPIETLTKKVIKPIFDHILTFFLIFFIFLIKNFLLKKYNFLKFEKPSSLRNNVNC